MHVSYRGIAYKVTRNYTNNANVGHVTCSLQINGKLFTVKKCFCSVSKCIDH